MYQHTYVSYDTVATSFVNENPSYDRILFQTVSENARLDVNSSAGDDDLELWDQSGFMLRTDVDDPLTNAK